MARTTERVDVKLAVGPPPDVAPLSVNASSVKVTARGVSRFFKSGGVRALHNVSFDLENGEFLSIVGPSGCGKTTLLRIVDGLIAPDEGEVRVDGCHPSPGPHIGVVFQQPRLLPWKTAFDNVVFPLRANGVPTGTCVERANDTLELVGLGEFRHAYPGELSGGMEQRVGLARAIAMDPELLLMDEPFGALDAITRQVMQRELARICGELKTSVVFVTHDIDEAVLLSDRVLVMSPQPGRIADSVSVSLGDDRWVDGVTDGPDFRSLRDRIWKQISVML